MRTKRVLRAGLTLRDIQGEKVVAHLLAGSSFGELALMQVHTFAQAKTAYNVIMHIPSPRLFLCCLLTHTTRSLYPLVLRLAKFSQHRSNRLLVVLLSAAV